MHFENLEAIVDFAIEKEREAAKFYDNISKNEDLPSKNRNMKTYCWNLKPKESPKVWKIINSNGLPI